MTATRRCRPAALVTGAGGFIGANLVRRLLAEGHQVTAVVRPGGEPWRLERADADVVELDLREPDDVADLIGDRRPAWVFHLAAHGAYSWQRDAADILRVNVLGTQAVLDAALDCGAEAIVQAGSSSEYGRKDHAPSEDEALEPNSVYAAAKACATMLASETARRRGASVTTLRVYSAYGPWEDPRRLVPTLLANALGGQLPDLVAAETARDFVWIEDVVGAFLLAARTPQRRPGAVYNVGSGTQTTVGELVEKTRALLGVAAEPRWGSAAARDWDTSTWVANPSRISSELGWSSDVEVGEGLRRMLQWLEATPEVHERYGVSAAPARSPTSPLDD